MNAAGQTSRKRRRPGAAWALAVAATLGAAATACVVPPGPPLTPGNPGTSDVQFTIASNQGVHSISPWIYGINGSQGIAQNRQTVVRQGGNRWTAYNWETNASNAGSDWCFQNDGLLSESNTPGAAIVGGIDDATSHGAASILTVPIVDYVAADKNGGCDVRNSGANYLQTRFKQNHDTKPTALSTTPNAGDGNVYQDEYVNWVKANRPSSLVMFSLDNEPDLWSSTHAEVHPNPVTYAELAQRNIDYAKAVKRVYPNAPVLGPVNYGFYGYERLQGAPDNGNRNFLDWYLDQMKAADTANGKRLVDYLDLHYYPEASGNGIRITGTDTSTAVVNARLQAPRSLWDANYVESSWITDPGGYNYGPINLINRTKTRITQHYPGTQLAFTEWNFGGGDHISGGIATADVLGIYGRESVGVATLWPLNGQESYTYAAFRAFRNFDGNGGSFGDMSMQALNSDPVGTSVYASYNALDSNRVVIVAINKTGASKKAGIRVGHHKAFSTAKVYTLTSAGANMVAKPDISTVATNAFNYTMPAYSVSVIVPQ